MENIITTHICNCNGQCGDKCKCKIDLLKNMEVLVLEDTIDKNKIFNSILIDGSRYYTDNAFQAIALMTHHKFDLIFLDNDLGKDNGEGIDVARYICENKNRFLDSRIIIHSWNFDARKQMINMFNNKNIWHWNCPFDKKDIENVYRQFKNYYLNKNMKKHKA